MNFLIFISGEQVNKILDMQTCIQLMRETLSALSRGEAIQVLRTAMKLEGRNVLGVMPSALLAKNIVGTKVITIVPDNSYKGLPSHQGVVIVFEAETGSLKAIVEGETVTAIRTAAVSAVATDILSRKDANSLAILGTGVQARMHVEAILQVRDIEQVYVWDRRLESAVKFSKEMSEKFDISIVPCPTSEEAVKHADIICTVTAAKEPVLFGSHVKKGTHINAVGSCTPDCRELDTELIKACKLYTDRMESAIHEAGDYLIPLREGAIDEQHIMGEIGDILVGRISGRQDREEITVFEALGLAVEDLAAADFVINQVEQREKSR
ncbi:ornithine cyclodeaminase family protein [Brevibacillus reuszeri]|uniref:ornithine cyclodeaminase family protein n=1 Tax=Brevibacillus reuszeri TaxID=54915 RepID=UPI0028A1FED0|nr:ornithine cyclodeaminase family protein [Brevibacillus reuszeri]